MAEELPFAPNTQQIIAIVIEVKKRKKNDFAHRLTPITIAYNHFGCYIESFSLHFFLMFCFVHTLPFILKCQFEIELPH